MNCIGGEVRPQDSEEDSLIHFGVGDIFQDLHIHISTFIVRSVSEEFKNKSYLILNSFWETFLFIYLLFF